MVSFFPFKPFSTCLAFLQQTRYFGSFPNAIWLGTGVSDALCAAAALLMVAIAVVNSTEVGSMGYLQV